MFTKEYLHEIFRYEDGNLYWKIDVAKNVKAGSICRQIDYKGYKKVKFNGKSYFQSRIIFMMHYGVLPKTIDHINCIKTDNRIENLRKASIIENGQNKKIQKNNKSGFKNVHWCKTNKKWVVTIKVNKKSMSVGSFKDIELADLVAQEARNKYHKNFANHG
jgi:hypothetical protein